jgi:MHS family proline/betaine transporter-like MFS transporter
MKVAEQRSLTREQKEAVGLLSIGTLLEYFDLMLYVHMAVLLNELFFPKTDPFTASLLSAFAFCSTFVFRPFGALIFGYMGDTMGRRITVVITTIMMAISCIIMAISPTYAEIGITASVIITLCRIIQGLSSMGEVIGAELYVAETIQKPYRYFYVSIIPTLATTGGMLALAVATFVTQYTFNWRYAFWAGAIIALIGTIARSSLRETRDFVDAKQRLKRNFDLIKSSTNTSIDFSHQLIQEKTNPKTFLALFCIGCSWPVCFYLCYIHCGNILREFYNFSPPDVIQQNFIVSIVHTLSYFVLAFLSLKIHPMRIVKIKILIFTVFSCFLPILLNSHSEALHILLIQLFIVIFSLTSIPASAIFYKCFPVFQRFKCCSFTYALSRAVMHVITSFGMIYIIDRFGNWGILIILIPIIILFTWGILHFCKLEKEQQEAYC